MTDSTLSPVYGYLPRPSMLDFRGHLATVFFLPGCNFRCKFCHNDSLINQSKERLTWDEISDACKTFQENWIDGVVITGGEPTLSPDLRKLIELFKSFNLKVKLDTNGSNPEILKSLIPIIDYVAVDIKTALDDYPNLTSFTNLDKLKETIALLKSDVIPYEFRTTLIEGYHTKEHLQSIKDTIQGSKRYILQHFVPRDSVLDEQFRAMPRTSEKFVLECEKFFQGSVEELIVA